MFRNRIAYWAEVKGVKHKFIASKCDVSLQTFSRWVQNKTQPDLYKAYIIATILNVSVDDLCRVEEKGKTQDKGEDEN